MRQKTLEKLDDCTKRKVKRSAKLLKDRQLKRRLRKSVTKQKRVYIECLKEGINDHRNN